MAISDEQATRANFLVNDVSAYPHLIALAQILPSDVKDQLRVAHDAKPESYCCTAHSEGLSCCIDILLTDPAEYAPAKVAEAEDLLQRYRSQ